MIEKKRYDEVLLRVLELEALQARHSEIDHKLSEREAFLRTLIETIPDLVWLKDPEGVYLACNRKLERLFGSSESEILGKTDYDFVSISQADSFRANDLATIQNRGPTVNEEEVTYVDDGHTELVETIKTPMYDQEGHLLGVLGVSRDITERKRIEKALRHSENRLRLTLEVANIGAWNWDISQDRWKASSIYHSMLGYEPVSGYGDREMWLNRVHPDDRKMVEDKIAGILDYQTNQYQYEARMLHADGTYRWHFVIGSVLERDEDNKPTYLSGLRIDIDERVRADAERERLQAQLAEAQKMQAIGRLAGGVAHDFNNMLAVIMGQTDLLHEQTEPSNPIFASLQSIQKAAEHSAGLTKQLLAFARKQAVAPKVIDLNEIIDKMLGMLKRAIGKDITLAWNPAQNLHPVLMDSVQVEQILINLCVNARDSIAKHGEIVISTRNSMFDEEYCTKHPGVLPGEFATISVKDNGCGMTRELIAGIFEPFFTTKGEGKGTGLGLSTIYGIVNQNRGFLLVDSEPGLGSLFEVFLPRHALPTKSSSEEEQDSSADGPSKTILVVEDHAAVLKICQNILSKHGYNVLAASSPAKALEILDSFPGDINILVSDVLMPEMNGPDLSQLVRAKRPEIKVLFMSGYTADIIDTKGSLDDGVHFLQKPFSGKELLSKVREAIGEE